VFESANGASLRLLRSRAYQEFFILKCSTAIIKLKGVSLRGGSTLPDEAIPSRARRLLRRKNAASQRHT